MPKIEDAPTSEEVTKVEETAEETAEGEGKAAEENEAEETAEAGEDKAAEEEKKAAGLYAKGLLPGEIAEKLGKSESTIKRQLYNAYKRLNLPHPRWLIRLFSVYNITT